MSVIVEDTIHLNVNGLPLIYQNSIDRKVLIETRGRLSYEKQVMYELSATLDPDLYSHELITRNYHFMIQEDSQEAPSVLSLEVTCSTIDGFTALINRIRNQSQFIARVEMKKIQLNLYVDRRIMRKVRLRADEVAREKAKRMGCRVGRRAGFSEDKTSMVKYLKEQHQNLENYGWLEVKDGRLIRVHKMTSLNEFPQWCD